MHCAFLFSRDSIIGLRITTLHSLPKEAESYSIPRFGAYGLFDRNLSEESVKFCVLNTAWLLRTTTHVGCGYPGKIKSVKITAWMGSGS